MNDKIYQGFKSNIKSILKQMGAQPFIFAIVGLLLSSLLFFCFGVMEYIDYGIWILIICILIFAGLCYVTFPFLYGVTLSVADSCRFTSKKYSISSLFDFYYRGNRGVFGIWNVFWRTFLVFILSVFLSSMIASLVIRYALSPMWDGLMTYIEEVSLGHNVTLESALGANLRLFEVISMICLSFSTLCSVVMWDKEIRKNESVFFCASSLITDNRVNMASGNLIPLFRRGVMSSVSKEYNKYNFLINWPGYLVFFVVFAGVVVLGIFLPSIPFFLTPFIALSGGCLFYAPFYVVARIFDNLFYIAYSDKIKEKVPSRVRTILQQGQDAMDRQFHFDDNNNSTNDDEASTSSSDLKKGSKDDDGTIDFTKKNDDGNSEDKKK